MAHKLRLHDSEESDTVGERVDVHVDVFRRAFVFVVLLCVCIYMHFNHGLCPYDIIFMHLCRAM